MGRERGTEGIRPIPYGRQLIDDEDVAAVVAQLREDFLTQGPTVARFEEAIAEIGGAKYAVAVSSGTAALHLASVAAGVRAGSTGVTSTITFVASANGIRYAGGKPSLTDVDPTTGLMDLASLEVHVARLETAGTPPKVLVPVDFGGTPADLPAVRRIADRIGATVIEDAAHSLGATYTHEGTTYRAGCGIHAQMACFSFHPVKHITTGEGGAILTNDEGAYRELQDLRTHGITKDPARLTRNDGPWYYEQQSLGYHYRITDLACALGLSQARKAERFVARRRAIAAKYDRAFEDATLAQAYAPLRVPAGRLSSYHLYVVGVRPQVGESIDSVRERRKRLFMRLREESIFCQVHYIPLHHQPDFVANGLVEGPERPGAEAYYAGCVSLPVFPAMRDEDADRVIHVLAQFSSGPDQQWRG